MSLTAECSLALMRGLVVAGLALLLGSGLRKFFLNLAPRRGHVSRLTGPARRIAWVLLLVPYLTPVLLVDYACRSFFLTLVHHPWLKELLYDLVLLARLTPVATLVLYFSPATMSPQAMHCYRLVRAQPFARKWLGEFWLRGSARAPAVAGALVFLWVFGDFELASLLGIQTWTVTIFDAQTGGLALHESLRLARLPLACAAILAFLALWLLFTSQPQATRVDSARVATRQWLAWGYLGFSAMAVCFLPLVLVLRDAVAGFSVLAQNFVLGRDLAASVLFGAGAAICAYVAAGWFARVRDGRPTGLRMLTAFALCVPALIGALLLAILVVAAFQVVGLRAGYDTPLPLLLALAWLLFPFALLLRALVNIFTPGEALHLARLLRARWLVWELKTRTEFWLVFVLFVWAYFDFTAAALLAPSGMTPVAVRLYNLMHYGQISVLSAMVCVAFALPLALLLAGRGVCGLIWRSKFPCVFGGLVRHDVRRINPPSADKSHG